MTREELKTVWRALFRTTPPNTQQWEIWERSHDATTLQEAMLQTAIKQRSLGGVMDAEYQIKFCSSVANRLRRQKLDAIEKLKATQTSVTITITAAVADDDDDARGNR